jgi:hypothetical protein
MNPPFQCAIAHVGIYQNFGAYMAFYETAVERLFDVLQSGAETSDTLAMPILALMRHSMELGYKYSLWELHQMMDEKFDSQKYGHHELPSLHKSLYDYFKRTVEHYRLPDHVMDGFEKYRLKTETAMQKFSALDKLSFSFRYPIDKKSGGVNFGLHTTIDLSQMRQLYDEAMILLRHTADVVGEYVDIHRHMQAEMRQFQGVW